MNTGNSFSNQCTVHSRMHQDVPCDSDTPGCLFPLQPSTPHQLTAFADTHTEHNQLPHVHVNSCTCRCTVLCYTLSPLHTRKLILTRRTVLFLHSFRIYSLYLGQGKMNFIHNYRLHFKLIIYIMRKEIPNTTNSTITDASTTATTATTGNGGLQPWIGYPTNKHEY